MPWLAFHRFGAPPIVAAGGGYRSFMAFWIGGGSSAGSAPPVTALPHNLRFLCDVGSLMSR